jgi:hypothetical protein
LLNCEHHEAIILLDFVCHESSGARHTIRVGFRADQQKANNFSIVSVFYNFGVARHGVHAEESDKNSQRTVL